MGSTITETRFLALLLRGIRDDLTNFGTSSSAEAREHLHFAHLTLDRYCAGLEAGTDVGESHSAAFIALAGRAAKILGAEPADGEFVHETFGALRARIAASIGTLAAVQPSDPAQAIAVARLLDDVLAEESRLKAQIDAVQTRRRYTPPHSARGADAQMTPQTLSSYLQHRFPTVPADVVTQLRVLPGGRSKRTIFATLKPNDALPCEAVIRQDMPGGAVDTLHGTTSVVREFPLLRGLGDSELPIARALLHEPQDSLCGAPFMIVERLAGEVTGTFVGFSAPHEPMTLSIVRDLAAVLAKMHRVDVRRLGLADDLTALPEQRLRLEVDFRWEKWRRDAVEPSPIMECALARLRAECRPGLGGPALVHGDAMSHNLLAAGGRITALLDWEFAHVGDPAQDLAYCRDAVEQVMEWDEFIALYIRSGGLAIDERRLAVFGLVGCVRNCSFAASFARRYLNDPVGDVTGAAAGYFSIPMLETQMLKLLHRLGPL